MLQFCAHSDVPFSVVLAADPVIAEANLDEHGDPSPALGAYRTGVGSVTDLSVPDGATIFTIRALSKRKLDKIKATVEAQFPGLAGKAIQMYANINEGAEYTPEVMVDLMRLSLMQIELELALVRASLVQISSSTEGLEGDLASLFDPTSLAGIYPLTTRAEILTELAGVVRRASELGPLARQHFNPQFGSPTPLLQEQPRTPGGATVAAIKTEPSAATAEDPSSQGCATHPQTKMGSTSTSATP